MISKKTKAGLPRKKNAKGEFTTRGQPTIMTDKTKKILEDAFLGGVSNITIACGLAGITRQTYYNHCKEDPQFDLRCKTLRDRPLVKAMQNIAKAIDEGDIHTSKWVLERRVKEDFSIRQELTGEDGEAIKQDINLQVVFTNDIDDK
jgi:hypothetical protein